MCLVGCLIPSVSVVKKERIESGVISSNSMFPKCSESLVRVLPYTFAVFFSRVHLVIILVIADCLEELHFTPPVGLGWMDFAAPLKL